MKMKTSQLFFGSYKRILGIFMIIDNSSTQPYVKAMLTFLNYLEYWQTYDMPIWNLIQEQLSVLNEEFGEIALSMLSSCNKQISVA